MNLHDKWSRGKGKCCFGDAICNTNLTLEGSKESCRERVASAPEELVGSGVRIV